ncbi:MAG: rRNA maturation RNase YbeY [Candidatus Peregrinibacteria bacterium]
MKIVFLNHQDWGIEPKAFKPLMARLKKAVDVHQGALNVVFVNDAYIRALNKQYRGQDEPTDVLSFTYGEGDLLGEIYISVPMAKRQAEQFKHSLADELSKLFVHGFLHIHGHDHESDEDYERMKTIEDEVLNKR